MSHDELTGMLRSRGGAMRAGSGLRRRDAPAPNPRCASRPLRRGARPPVGQVAWKSSSLDNDRAEPRRSVSRQSADPDPLIGVRRTSYGAVDLLRVPRDTASSSVSNHAGVRCCRPSVPDTGRTRRLGGS